MRPTSSVSFARATLDRGYGFAVANRRAADVAERMRANVAATPLEGLPEPATISIGISTCQQVEPAADVWEALLREADTQLYRAKSAGRNRVVTIAD